MDRFLSNPIPAIAAAHVAALTTASAAPVFRGAGLLFRWRAAGPRSEFLDAGWRPGPAAIMRGWEPRQPESNPVRRWWTPLAARLAVAFDQVAEWQERVRSRRTLLSMDDHALRDIGVDRATADYEGNLPFWRARP